MERRRAANGQAYTFEKFRVWYQADARTFWDKALEVRMAPNGYWYTKTEWAAWTKAKIEQAAASPAAEQRQAAGAPAKALEPAREQAPASPATEQREAACGSLSPPERAMASGAASKRGACFAGRWLGPTRLTGSPTKERTLGASCPSPSGYAINHCVARMRFA